MKPICAQCRLVQEALPCTTCGGAEPFVAPPTRHRNSLNRHAWKPLLVAVAFFLGACVIISSLDRHTPLAVWIIVALLELIAFLVGVVSAVLVVIGSLRATRNAPLVSIWRAAAPRTARSIGGTARRLDHDARPFLSDGACLAAAAALRTTGGVMARRTCARRFLVVTDEGGRVLVEGELVLEGPTLRSNDTVRACTRLEVPGLYYPELVAEEVVVRDGSRVWLTASIDEQPAAALAGPRDVFVRVARGRVGALVRVLVRDAR